jgi:hypothetical protein
MPVSSNYIDGSMTIASGSMHLDGGGYALQILRISETGMITRPEHAEITYYRTLIDPPAIRLAPLSCSEGCAVEAIGQISGSTITLTLAHPFAGSVYTYQRASTM